MIPVPVPPVPVKRLAVIGVGLIGGSFSLDLKRLGCVGEVVGAGRSSANLDVACQRGVIDHVAASAAEAVADADLVLMAAPVGAMPALFAEIASVLSPKALVTDVGSTKQDVIAAARTALGGRARQFVPAHPIAGAENSGAEAARHGLFSGKPLILTPLPENDSQAVNRLAALWAACGARVVRMAAAEHDRIFAAVSHLPHLAAFALMDELAGRPDGDNCMRYAGAGFRDFTRIAASHPAMWRDISLANRAALVTELDAYLAKLQHVRSLVAAGDGPALEALFERARSARRHWQATSTPLTTDVSSDNPA